MAKPTRLSETLPDRWTEAHDGECTSLTRCCQLHMLLPETTVTAAERKPKLHPYPRDQQWLHKFLHHQGRLHQSLAVVCNSLICRVIIKLDITRFGFFLTLPLPLPLSWEILLGCVSAALPLAGGSVLNIWSLLHSAHVLPLYAAITLAWAGQEIRARAASTKNEVQRAAHAEDAKPAPCPCLAQGLTGRERERVQQPTCLLPISTLSSDASRVEQCQVEGRSGRSEHHRSLMITSSTTSWICGPRLKTRKHMRFEMHAKQPR